MALWGGRFTQAADERFKQFNDSISFDYLLAKQDVLGSIGWAKALHKVAVLDSSECERLIDALNQLLVWIDDDDNNLASIAHSDAEDIHSFIEKKLIEKVGDLGKKLHTGRSRNDQVATDIKLWCKARIEILQQSLTKLIIKLTQTADDQQAVIMPGYTHLQRAQPITFAHWCMAYVEMFERDLTRLNDALTRLDVCPLGCGALAGSAYNIDREQLALDLGFNHATNNSLDSVSDRDHIAELLFVATLSMVHLSRFAEDLIIFNSGEADFVELSDLVTSGSSLMPQKKNPDALELIRGKTGRVFGHLSAITMTLKGLPLAYNKDMQEDKEGLFDGLKTWNDCLDMASLVLDDIKLNHEKCSLAAKQGYSNATELADYLVEKGVAFRDAHHISGKAVVYAISVKKALEELSLDELKQFSANIENDVYPILSLQSCLQKRNAKGGVNPDQINSAIQTKLAKYHIK